MQRILVMGPSGAGKSTLARELGRRLGIDVVHLDMLHFTAGWVEVDPSWEETRLREIVAGERWIIDGNYRRLLDIRLPRSDTVIFLDFPRRTSYWRVLKRLVRHVGRTRPDMAPGCPERIDWEFVKWIWEYPHAEPPTRAQSAPRGAA
jgi:adenylate kinase family enzyme